MRVSGFMPRQGNRCNPETFAKVLRLVTERVRPRLSGVLRRPPDSLGYTTQIDEMIGEVGATDA